MRDFLITNLINLVIYADYFNFNDKVDYSCHNFEVKAKPMCTFVNVYI